MPNSLNPLEQIAQRWQPSARFVRRAALATVVMAVVIVVTGGAVRLTQSGLGCPTWPTCTEESLTPTREMGINGVIEFGNRMLTYVLCAVVGLFIIAARARSPRRRSLTRLGWAQFWIVMGNAVVGGVTVLTGLNPYIVSAHFLLSTSLLTVSVVGWQRTREGDAEPRDLVVRPVRQLSWLLVVASGVLIMIGTVVTGAGKHAGDASKDVHRIPLDWREVTQLHVDFVFIVLGLTVALWFTLRAVKAPADRRRTVLELLGVLLAQGAIGYTQYFLGQPELVVGLHMLGSCLVWIAVLRVLLCLRERGEQSPESAGTTEPTAETTASAVPAPAGEPEAVQPEAAASSAASNR
ncbi:COX15/CtaA family protein [Streptomyces sp. H27-D2]|uniref:COX15/CtaA family protein n=1 Tax=Streptomyces sp. H27-D2 TaxID=3046304 RepID=UPI002DB9F2E8|nr:COX15/CtaA family protein [Streptomyces sp. H27-D2]MEC4020827.1 COX15/CtaA family protein [Streptomyces sp. H27-D2]